VLASGTSPPTHWEDNGPGHTAQPAKCCGLLTPACVLSLCSAPSLDLASTRLWQREAHGTATWDQVFPMDGGSEPEAFTSHLLPLLPAQLSGACQSLGQGLLTAWSIALRVEGRFGRGSQIHNSSFIYYFIYTSKISFEQSSRH
jgi:hypothetical protein